MRKFLLFTLLFTFWNVTSQSYENQWKDVVRNEIDGKTKSASELVDKIYKKAHRENNEVQIIKCFFYQSKFIQALEENAQTKIIQHLRSEIRKSSKLNESVLNYLYAEILYDYSNYHQYKIQSRTDLKENLSDDFLTWTREDFENEIKKAYSNTLKNEQILQSTELFFYKEVIDILPHTETKKYSLFDFFIDKNTHYFKNKINNYEYENESLWEVLISETPEFLKFNPKTISDESLQRIVSLMQLREEYYLKSDKERLEVAYYERLKLSKNNYALKSKFIERIEQLEQTTLNESLKQELRLQRVNYWYTITQKGDKNNYYDEALQMIDVIFKSNVNRNTLAEAEIIKNKIISQSLKVKLKKIVYPNENLRALVNFKNVDSITVSYYKFPTKLNTLFDQYSYRDEDYKKVKKDSLILNFISKNKPVKAFKLQLPNKKDYFNYSTEILLEKLDVGNYLIFMETKNNSEKDSKVFVYENVISSCFNYLQFDTQNQDTFNVVDRKTGKPVENVIVKNNDSNVKTNSTGKVSFNKIKGDHKTNNFSKLFFIKENDTLTTSYFKSFLSSKKEETFKAKSMIYFDRGIYRPGQKVYFKGIVVQKKGKEKSVVPYVTVNVIIEDANDNEVKKFDIQTNEFGSFAAEYEIPKNVLTGQFSVTVEEPEIYNKDTKYYDSNVDEHSFWDEVDYDAQRFYFQVEEYKRPTFEIKFDEIKENYTIGDVVKIKGNAKTLAGSNLTNAKVIYTLSRRINYSDDYENENNYLSNEVFTDENGNFLIEFNATQEGISNSEIEMFNYSIQVEITDTNGETRTAQKSLIVGKRMLQLDSNLISEPYVENPLMITISATTLNNYPIDTNGEISIYHNEKKHFLINRIYDFPEIQTLTRSQFESLFPYEPYDQTDDTTNEKLVTKINFDTQKSKAITIDKINHWQTGHYNIKLHALDQNNNAIAREDYFELNSKENKISSKDLFTYKITHDLPNYLEVEFFSIIPDLYITTRFYTNLYFPEEFGTQLTNGYGKLKIKKTSKYEADLQFHFSTFWENQYRSENETIEKEIIEPKLKFEIISLRTKIEPGSNETWSFKIKDNKTEAEFLAGMYDSSLDQLSSFSWNNVYFYESDRAHFPYNNKDNFINLNFKGFYTNTFHYKNYTSKPDFYWFGFDFNNPQNNRLTKRYLEKALSIAETPKNAKLIFGYVFDDKGSLPGANVVVKGTNRGVQTDMDGRYEIEVVKGEKLIFSFIGMFDKELEVGKAKMETVILEQNESILQEVVVEGYRYVTNKKSIAYSTVSVKSFKADADEEGYKISDDEMESGFMENLQGQIAGLSYGGGSGGGSGTGLGIVIRGIGSVSSNKEPLYVIDGVPTTREEFLKLNPNEVKSATVLKNSAAVTLYGSRASNGVIVIVSKNAMKELSQVKARTNFNETAFFYPQLKTDTDGKIVFSFTAPESLTKWNLRLYAHNKKAQSGYFQTDVISQKDVMMMPNMPRFVRENDKLTISAKVVNMTNQPKSGLAMLLLFDATNMKPIDSLALNKNNVINFSCKPKESVPVQWIITIPEHLQGLQYKIVAKSGNFSDGEENILPVLTNKILVTESIPLWVRGNTKKEYTFENLKNNSSTTLQNHKMTLEYTTNPTWLVLQSLPYLLEYQHECAEQTFARYYANTIATEIINSNPKVAALFDKWRLNGTVQSKLEMNEELKSTILAESPWLMDTKSEEEKNKRLAILFDLDEMKQKNEETFTKLVSKILPNGGFPWFDGGNENIFISQHILSGIGHLNSLFPKNRAKYETIIKKGIPNLDENFINRKKDKNRVYYWDYTDIHYLYTRSFYVDKYPFSKEVDSLAQLEIDKFKKNWLTYSLYQKGMMALVLHRLKEHDFAKKIITHLKESASNNVDYGMYWIENSGGYYWYNSSIETQALLIEAFSEIENDIQSVEAMKVWLIKNKQVENWSTTKSTTEAIYALLFQGNDWKSVKENTKIKLGNEMLLTKKLTEKQEENSLGYYKINWKKDEITTEMATISIDNKTDAPGFGGVYWQYFEELEKIKSDSTATLSISKKIFKKIKTTEGNQLIELDKETVKVGDLITIRLIVRSQNNLEFVHLKDLRASCFEPVDVISNYHWGENTSYYKSTKDAATHFFFDDLRKGTYIFEYDVRVNNSGQFSDGIATIQSMYAPEYGSHSTVTHIEVK